MRRLNEEWASDIVGRLHRIGVTQIELAERCGYTPSYISMILNNRKEFSSQYAAKITHRRINKAVEELEHEILKS